MFLPGAVSCQMSDIKSCHQSILKQLIGLSDLSFDLPVCCQANFSVNFKTLFKAETQLILVIPK